MCVCYVPCVRVCDVVTCMCPIRGCGCGCVCVCVMCVIYALCTCMRALVIACVLLMNVIIILCHILPLSESLPLEVHLYWSPASNQQILLENQA